MRSITPAAASENLATVIGDRVLQRPRPPNNWRVARLPNVPTAEKNCDPPTLIVGAFGWTAMEVNGENDAWIDAFVLSVNTHGEAGPQPIASPAAPEKP